MFIGGWGGINLRPNEDQRNEFGGEKKKRFPKNTVFYTWESGKEEPGIISAFVNSLGVIHWILMKEQ